MPEGMAFLWDGGILTDEEVDGISLTDPEILSIKFCTTEDIARLVKPTLAGRITAALLSVERGTITLCEAGQPVE